MTIWYGRRPVSILMCYAHQFFYRLNFLKSLGATVYLLINIIINEVERVAMTDNYCHWDLMPRIYVTVRYGGTVTIYASFIHVDYRRSIWWSFVWTCTYNRDVLNNRPDIKSTDVTWRDCLDVTWVPYLKVHYAEVLRSRNLAALARLVSTLVWLKITSFAVTF